jgi:uncharacterized protein YecE (DUF72 family)
MSKENYRFTKKLTKHPIQPPAPVSKIPSNNGALAPMLYLATSGWSYTHWRGTFYPAKLVARDQLPFLARHFSTVELNSSFYRLPAVSAFQRWYDVTPPGFRFAVKVPRTITHIKRLNNAVEDWQTMLERSAVLADKLGPYLMQFPPSFKATPETIGRFGNFLTDIHAPNIPLAAEMRHASWFEPQVLELFKTHKLCLVQAESSRYPHSPEGFSPSKIAYYRLHGPRELYASAYTDDELSHWASLIRADLAAGKDTYVYFDNDFKGYAIEDARRLRLLLEGE